jgi:hypothetical protein
MTTRTMMPDEIEREVDAVARDLVRLQRVNGSTFINLPLLYPDGSSVTVRVDATAKGLRVSDNGFAFRDADDMGASRSFGQNKKAVAEEFGVQFAQKLIFTETAADGLFDAVCDVAAASWQIASRVFSRLPDEGEVALEEELAERLAGLFGPAHVEKNKQLHGASSVAWPVSALVSFPDHKTIFQAVGDNANSVNRSATAFRDLSLLPKPPRIVAVVRDLAALGARASLLTQASARIVEQASPDGRWKAAA